MTWTIVNTGARPIVGALELEASAFDHPRAMEVRLDGQLVQTFVVEQSRCEYRIGPLDVAPGDHELVFHPSEPPAPAGDVIHDGDRRRLSFAIGRSNWSLGSGQP